MADGLYHAPKLPSSEDKTPSVQFGGQNSFRAAGLLPEDKTPSVQPTSCPQSTAIGKVISGGSGFSFRARSHVDFIKELRKNKKHT